MTADRPRTLGALKTVAAFRAHVAAMGLNLPIDGELLTGTDAPLGQSFTLDDGRVIGNRFCIHPMEGWDGTDDGRPTELTFRRWTRFGAGGAKLIWGGEAVAVRPDGRANPNQLLINQQTLGDLARLRLALVDAHASRFGRTDDLLVGLQLTHSGRYSRPYPNRPLIPLAVQRHPVLDARVGLAPDHQPLSDQALEDLAQDFVVAAVLAQQAGFGFVDVKHCHGYLGHELLGAHSRPGAFGGSLANRSRFLRLVAHGIRKEAPGLAVGVRLSAADIIPFRRGPDGRGVPEAVSLPYQHGFGVRPDAPETFDLDEPFEFLALLAQLDIQLLNITVGSPYYNPHFQRPALYPPSDGYDPPRDPLHEVAEHLAVTAACKRKAPKLFVVGSGWSYLQEFLPNVAQVIVRTGGADAVGLGRMALSYPDLPADVLAGRSLDRHKVCRTFSDCTTGPRNGLVSGCFPLDPLYKARPEAAQVKGLRPIRGASGS